MNVNRALKFWSPSQSGYQPYRMERDLAASAMEVAKRLDALDVTLCTSITVMITVIFIATLVLVRRVAGGCHYHPSSRIRFLHGTWCHTYL